VIISYLLFLACGSNKTRFFSNIFFQTIEDRILQLQEEKQSVANQALGTEAAKKMNKLSVNEILCRFLLSYLRACVYPESNVSLTRLSSSFDWGLQI
jgi:hypothetical protein